jgi:hypothetical protein
MVTQTRAERWAQSMREDYRPHRLMKTTAGLMWETISYPWADGERVRVNVRVPGDPTTMIEVDVFDLSPEGADCLCHNSIRSEFYFVDSPADAARRARDVEFLTRRRSDAAGQPTFSPTAARKFTPRQKD